MTTERTGSAQQIAMSLNLLSLRKHLFQESRHDRFLFQTDATTIKINTRDLVRIQIRKKFLTQDSGNDTPILMERINALGMEMLQRA